jgi:Cof subfamily protein (haloacid dehalogenase superfamily)
VTSSRFTFSRFHIFPPSRSNHQSPSSRLHAFTFHAFPHTITIVEHNIQLVAVDLDGTLLDSSKRVSEQTVAALACLPGKSVRLVIASARPPRSVRPIYNLLNLDTLQINYNGALIWDEPAKKAVYHAPMKPELVLEMIELARDMFEEVAVSCEILDRWYTDASQQMYMTETGKLFRPDVVAPIAEFCRVPITKLMLMGEPPMIARLEQLFGEAFPQTNIVVAEPELLQVTHPKADKSIALRKVAAHYGVLMENVMAIGDAANDIDMLKSVGFGVAMDNAHPLVKHAAKWVAPSNDDHGVHAALRKYGLCP